MSMKSVGDTTWTNMKVAVLGASGRVGSHIANELAARHYDVLAIARNPCAVPRSPCITAVAGDATDSDTFVTLIRGQDAVISALPFEISAAILLRAIKLASVGRLLVTGGAAGLQVAGGKRVIDAPDFPAEWRSTALQGIAFFEALKKETEVDWTFFAPAALLFQGSRLGHYRLGGDELVVDDAGNSKISFADYAIAMVDELEHNRHSRRRFTAAY